MVATTAEVPTINELVFFYVFIYLFWGAELLAFKLVWGFFKLTPEEKISKSESSIFLV